MSILPFKPVDSRVITHSVTHSLMADLDYEPSNDPHRKQKHSAYHMLLAKSCNYSGDGIVILIEPKFDNFKIISNKSNKCKSCDFRNELMWIVQYAKINGSSVKYQVFNKQKKNQSETYMIF